MPQQCSLIFTIAATFPVQLFVVTDVVEQEYLFKNARFGKGWIRLKSNIFRTMLVLFCVFVGVRIKKTG